MTVKPFGARHSQTDIICTEGIPVDLNGIKSFHMNDDGVTATFGAGVNLRDATEFLRHHNRGLRTTPAYGKIWWYFEKLSLKVLSLKVILHWAEL